MQRRKWYRTDFIYKHFYSLYFYGPKIAIWHEFLAGLDYFRRYGKPPTRGIVYWMLILFMPVPIKRELRRLRMAFYGKGLV